LSIRVHLAAVKEQQISRTYNLQTARAALNEALGLALDDPHQLTTPLAELAARDAATADFERQAAEARPEVRQAGLATRLAAAQVSRAQGALLPQVSLRGVFEADRQRFVDQGGANWFVGATLRWEIFNGNSDRARIREASEELAAARKQQEQVDRGVRLQVRNAWGDYQSSRERVTVAQAAVSQAEESLRIIKNRYDNGLTTITELLRSETALLDARMHHLTALYNVRVNAAALYQSAGILTGDADVLR
jgi:outer membrane protein TolC